jgi:hypothetical protein
METTKEMPASEDTMGRASPGIVRHESLFQGYEEHFELRSVNILNPDTFPAADEY